MDKVKIKFEVIKEVKGESMEELIMEAELLLAPVLDIFPEANFCGLEKVDEELPSE